MKPTHAVFVFNLVQDVAILRPLIYLAARDFDYRVSLLVSERFLDRDWRKTWQAELGEIASHLNADLHIFSSPLAALAILQGKRGLIFAGSESSLQGHVETHQLFRVAPDGFLKITLQHGYECVGFLNSRQHDIAHGRAVTFAADVVCGWSAPETLTSLVYSQRPKLCVTGPTSVLQARAPSPGARATGGLVCENLHSVRLKASGNVTGSFMDSFNDFCGRMASLGRTVNLRPHPGGQFVLKNNVLLPPNVVIQNNPIYKVDLPSYEYGISAPSSVLIDFALAGIPAAVWKDADGVMDTRHYDGLTSVSAVDDWAAFAEVARSSPEQILARQSGYLDGLKLVHDPKEVYRRFARLLGSPAGGRIEAGSRSAPAADRPLRVTFVANGMIPTLQLSFYQPLRPLIDAGEVQLDFVGETDLIEQFKKNASGPEAGAWLISRIADSAPDVIVCCRYSGPHTAQIVDLATELVVPLIFHVDDDLLNIPKEIGEKKFIGHNKPVRLEAVATLLDRADLVYCSTPGLKRRFRALGFTTPMVVGSIYCSGQVQQPAELRPVRKIGYMGFDHAHDLEHVLPALVRFLRRNPDILFELFGSIPRPKALDEFGERVVLVPPVRDYAQFLQAFAERRWDIGICPLVKSPFNQVKANTKWVEYTASGLAVVASAGTVYDECGSDGCAMLVDGDEAWLAALERLTDHPDERFAQVMRAQRRLTDFYNKDVLRRQVLDVFDQALAIVEDRKDERWPHVSPGALRRGAIPINKRPAATSAD